MNAIQPVAYDRLQAALSTAGLEPSAAEVHGVICGSICNQMKTGVSPDLQQLLMAGSDVPAESLSTLRGALEELLKGTVESLYGDDNNFNLLIPDEDQSLPIRLLGLADWCRGFMIGLLNRETLAVDQLSSESAEIARDVLAISEIEPSGKSEGDEWDLAEIEEYVRMGVQLIFEEMHAEVQSGSISGGVH